MAEVKPNATAKAADGTFVARWPKLIEGMQASPQELYVGLEESLAKREIPNLKLSRVDWREGGFFSGKREYLRIEWKRYICDYCAAPFGSGFFFSYWLVMIPPKLTIYHLAGMGVTFFILIFLFASLFGVFKGMIFLLIALGLLWWALKNGKIAGRVELEQFLVGLTIIGPIIDVFLRPMTYYEHDNASMFLAASHQSLIDVIDESMKTKGLTPLTALEKKPILHEFFTKGR